MFVNQGKSAKTVIDSARKHVAEVVGASPEGEFKRVLCRIIPLLEDRAIDL